MIQAAKIRKLEIQIQELRTELQETKEQLALANTSIKELEIQFNRDVLYLEEMIKAIDIFR